MFDSKVFDATDWVVQELHDREIPRRAVVRASAVLYLVSELLLRGLATPGFVFTTFVVLFVTWWEERREAKHGAKLLTAVNVAVRTTKFAMGVRVFMFMAAVVTVLAHTNVLGLANAVLYLWFFYLLYSVVPHEPPKRRRHAPKAVVVHAAS